MNKLIFLFGIILISLIAQSCTDSLGIDPNYTVEPADEAIGDGSSHQFSIDSVLFNIIENYSIAGSTKPDTWINSFSKYIKTDLKLDTTNSEVRIWLKLNVSNPNAGNPINPSRKDRIIAFQVNFRAILKEGKIYTLDGKADSWKLGSILVESKNPENISSFQTYDGNRINSIITFNNIHSKNIELELEFDVTPLGLSSTQNLKAVLTIPVSSS